MDSTAFAAAKALDELMATCNSVTHSVPLHVLDTDVQRAARLITPELEALSPLACAIVSDYKSFKELYLDKFK